MKIKHDFKLWLFFRLLWQKCDKKEAKEVLNPYTNSAQEIDGDKFVGKWYELANYAHCCERKLRNVRIEYTRIPDSEEYEVVITADNMKTNQQIRISGKGQFIKGKDVNEMKVTYKKIFLLECFIYEVGKNYEYVLLGSVKGAANMLWILSRTPEMKQEDLDFLKERIYYRGYDVDKLIWAGEEEVIPEEADLKLEPIYYKGHVVDKLDLEEEAKLVPEKVQKN